MCSTFVRGMRDEGGVRGVVITGGDADGAAALSASFGSALLMTASCATAIAGTAGGAGRSSSTMGALVSALPLMPTCGPSIMACPCGERKTSRDMCDGVCACRDEGVIASQLCQRGE